MDWKLELITIPVSDVDKSIEFYTKKVGFNLDHDHKVNENLRFVQLTPPGSACSIAFGTGLSKAKPGSIENLQLVVSDINAAHKKLKENGVEVSDIQIFDWGHFIFFKDPDGNGWAVQYIPNRKS